MLIKNDKEWSQHCKLLNGRVAAIDSSPDHQPVNPSIFPFFVYSYIIAKGNRYIIKHIMFCREHAKTLLSIK